MNAHWIALICVCALIGQSAAVSSNSLGWREYKRQHGKVYGAAEDAMRFANFLANKQLVERHNSNSSSSFKMGLNHFSDWSDEEFQQISGFEKSKSKKHWRVEAEFGGELLEGPLPDEVDWRKVPNRVGDVKDQGRCNSGWAFAATGLLEGQQAKLNFSKLVPLSEQELLDCSQVNKGCQGGSEIDSLDDVKSHGGIESEQDYGYEATQKKCRVNPQKAVMTIKHDYYLMWGDEQLLKKYVANYGPVAAYVDSTKNLMNYQSGILDDPDCDPRSISHGVLVVGYGQDSAGLHYWIVKNSWGIHWGEKGYFKIRRGVNMCGIAQLTTVAEV